MAEGQKVRAVMMVEVAGTPAEHVKKALIAHVSKLKNVKSLQVHSIEIAEPRELEERKGFYTTFAEVDFSSDTLKDLFDVMFDFMPSSIEITEPSNVSLNMEEATTLLNNVTGRLHRYDDIAKLMKARDQQLQLAINKLVAENEELKKGSGEKKKSAKPSKKKVKKKAGKKANNTKKKK